MIRGKYGERKMMGGGLVKLEMSTELGFGNPL